MRAALHQAIGKALQARVAHRPMHAIREQQENITDPQVTLHVVNHHAVFSAHGAQQLVPEVGVIYRMVFGELGGFAIAQQIGA